MYDPFLQGPSVERAPRLDELVGREEILRAHAGLDAYASLIEKVFGQAAVECEEAETLRIDGPDHVRRAVDQCVEQGPGLAELKLRHLALGDVVGYAHEALGQSRSSGIRTTAGHNPADFPVGVHDPVLDAEMLPVLNALSDGLSHELAVIGVDYLQEPPEGQFLVRGEAKQLAELVRHPD